MWIELHDSCRDHPKILKLARDLKIPQAQAVGHLCSLWMWTLRMAPDGDLESFDAEDIELGALWEGDPGAFTAAATRRHLLDEGPHGLVVHQWGEYANHLKAAQRKRAQRERERAERLASRDGVVDDEVSRDTPDPDLVVCDSHKDRPTDRPTRPDQTDRSDPAPPAAPVDAKIGTTEQLTQRVASWGWQIALSPKQIQAATAILDERPIDPAELVHAKAQVEKAKGGRGNAGLLLHIIADERETTPPPESEWERARKREPGQREQERKRSRAESGAQPDRGPPRTKPSDGDWSTGASAAGAILKQLGIRPEPTGEGDQADADDAEEDAA